MRFSTLAILASATSASAQSAKSCGTFNNMLVADMGDGDQKYVTLQVRREREPRIIARKLLCLTSPDRFRTIN